MKTILITGATGFLGSHIAEELINQGYNVIALKRSTSNLWRCYSFNDRIRWINCDSLVNAEPEIIECNPDILIHAAWNGVKATDRDNWDEQEKNLSFLVSLLDIVKKTNIKKIIALGSQAEYGDFEGSVDENYLCNPTSAYGANKICASILLKTFAELNQIGWNWIRIFSVFGPREEKNWLIPATINNLLEKKEMNLTPCEQKYDYLYTKDFANGILSVVKNDSNISGIYNMSSGKSIKLKDILSFLENKLSPKQKLLQIGIIPYRPHQVMHMEGNSDHFFRTFDFRPAHSIYEGLEETLNYYNLKRENE
ncbi:MAG: NAD(P)-dependent oxidoreductase [Prolixibacteraceae bacterium]|nr:NAD(P)-dependent oxidoreductase [Prolixibacteraceae bacterium]